MQSMQLLLRFLKAPTNRKLLAVHVFLTVVRVRAGLTIVGYKPRRQFQPRSTVDAGGVSALQIARYVSRISRFVPGASCLTQAVAAQRLLSVHGHSSHIRIGVKAEGKSFTAHAWLLFRERVILGGDEDSLAAYAVLTDLQEARMKWR